MISLGSFGQVSGGEPIADFWREFFVEMIGGDDTPDIGDGGWIGNCGTGRERRFHSERDIGNGESKFGGIWTGHGQAAAFYGRGVFANCVDFVDWSAASDEKLIELACVI